MILSSLHLFQKCCYIATYSHSCFVFLLWISSFFNALIFLMGVWVLWCVVVVILVMWVWLDIYIYIWSLQRSTHYCQSFDDVLLMVISKIIGSNIGFCLIDLNSLVSYCAFSCHFQCRYCIPYVLAWKCIGHLTTRGK